jgi:hypothetical protein
MRVAIHQRLVKFHQEQAWRDDSRVARNQRLQAAPRAGVSTLKSLSATVAVDARRVALR